MARREGALHDAVGREPQAAPGPPVAGEGPGCAPFPRVPVLALGAVVVLVLLAVAPRYGWHRDELYFLEAGRHLAWGYVDQPPFVVVVARAADALAPGNLAVLRLLPALATAATVALAAAIVRELGASTRAQAVGAAAVAGGSFVLGAGHLLSTVVFDVTAWMALLWATARLLRTNDPRWWLGFGAIAGVSMLNKHLVVLLAIAVVCGLVADRRWRLVVTPWAAGGAALALAIAAPHLLWEMDHGWPQLSLARALADRLAGENRARLLPLQLLYVSPLLVGTLIVGVQWLARWPGAHPYRPLLWAWLAGLVAVFVTAGRPYYVVPLTTVVLLAGVAARDDRAGLRRLSGLIALNAVGVLLLALPLLPRSLADVSAGVNEATAETLGWPELVEQVAGVVDDLPPAERRSVVLLTDTYGEAGAIAGYGRARGLPPVYSPHNSYADFGRPTDASATVVAVRFRPDELAPYFRRCRQVDTVDNGLGIDNEAQGTPIVVCRGLQRGWEATWEQLRHIS